MQSFPTLFFKLQNPLLMNSYAAALHILPYIHSEAPLFRFVPHDFQDPFLGLQTLQGTV